MSGDEVTADSVSESNGVEDPSVSSPPPQALPPLVAYVEALGKYPHAVAIIIATSLGLNDVRRRKNGLAETISEALAAPRAAERLILGLDHSSRLAIGIFALAEAYEWSTHGLFLTLQCLDVDVRDAIVPLLECGLIVLETKDEAEVLAWNPKLDPASWPRSVLRLFPGAMSSARTTLPLSEIPNSTDTVRLVRESDGLEPILRLAVLWQRVSEAPLRQTQSGLLYKRDRDRIEEDPALVGPIADAIEPLPDPAAFWLALGRSVGIIEAETGTERIIAAPATYWEDNAFHLPQMVASRWLSLTRWQEQGGAIAAETVGELALPNIRAACLLWLAKLEPDQWCGVEDLAAIFDRLAPGWARPLLDSVARDHLGGDLGGLEGILLGTGYQLGLIRLAEEVPSTRRVVQLSLLGRYVVGIGPPPPPRPTFDHFLFVQPNFEIIAYRQGLNPRMLGELGRFARWGRIGAALELVLSPASVYQSLEGGFSEPQLLEFLTKHSQRALPPGVAEAVRTWSSRRERVTYFASATLVEFASPSDLEAALVFWPTGRADPVRIADRLLLVEDESAIPFTRLRLAGSRDYRRAPEACLEVEADGVSLALDLGRSDLLVDAELARFADESRAGLRSDGRRRFVVTAASLLRGSTRGVSAATLSRWFPQRTGGPLPPAIRLLLAAATGTAPPLGTSRPIVVRTASAEWLDGLLQHPLTRPHLGDRLGPTAVIVPEESLETLRRVVEELGLKWESTEGPPTPLKRPTVGK